MTLNAGFNDAWFNPATPGQGFFITVFPDIQMMFLAWFTYDTKRPPPEVSTNLGEPGHRWLTAFGPYSGDTAMLDVELTQGGVFNSAEPAVVHSADGTIEVIFSGCNAGMIRYNITSPGATGQVPIERIALDNVPLCEALVALACSSSEPDSSHGPNNPPIVDDAIIPVNEIFDGGPGPDGIPSIDAPVFTQDFSTTNTKPSDLVVGVKFGNDSRAYPHHIIWWHEVVNDLFLRDGAQDFFTLNYCPLTGSAMLWKPASQDANKTFGTSGFLYNSNLIMYDRETESFWSQMLEQAVSGPQILKIPERRQVVETTWETWQAMYPETSLLIENTGFTRPYLLYPYGSYRSDESLLFPANNSNDNRLGRKERVLGINVGDSSKVYPINNFSAQIEVINDSINDMQVVVAGSSELNFGVVYNRELLDCTVLEFEAVQDQLPVIMRDNEGNEWDVFGTALSGERTGQTLQKTNSYIAYWFAWTAFFENAQIHQ